MAQDAFGLASLYDPSIAVDEAALQRQMLLAQALRQQSLDAQGRTQMAGNVAIRNSPLEGVAKVVQALRANQLDTQNDTSRQGLSTKAMAAMAQLLRGDQPGATAAGSAGVSPPSPDGSAPPQPAGAAPSGGMGMAQLLRGSVIGTLGGPAMAGAYAKNFEPLDIDRQLQASGIDPNSPLGKQYKQGRLAKENYVPPANIRPGGYTQDMSGNVQQFPQVPPGFQATPTGRGGFSMAPVQGGTQAIRDSTAAKAEGEAKFQPQEVFNPRTGAPEIRSRADVLGGTIPPAVQNGRDVDRMGILQQEKANLVKAGQSTADIDKEIALTQRQLGQTPGAFQAGPALGQAANAEAGAKNRQGVMKEDYTPLSGQSANAQTVISRLQTIKQLGPEAITGAQSEKRDFFNGLLSLAGIKSAADAKTAGDLIDKNAAQIALAIGAGSNGTDALRSLALTANPGRHMQLDAMQRAADSLIAPLQMTLAKNQLLTPHFASGDAENYFTKKLSFEKAADPRIWELGSLPPEAQQAYVSKLTPADAKKLLDSRSALKQLGALQ